MRGCFPSRFTTCCGASNMLRSLHIENIAVIRQVDVEFHEGLSVLTGETGAGKSIIIDSINLLLGNRVPKEIVRTGAERAVIAAVFEDLSDAACDRLSELGFDCSERSLMIQRQLSADGRTQTRLNGQIITQAVQRQLAPFLISIHGQMDSHRLLQKSAHLELLDAFAKPDDELAAYRDAFEKWRDAEKKLSALTHDESERLRMQEMLRYQIEDIDAMKLRDPDEEDRLLRERDRLANAEKINRQIELCYRLLAGGEKTDAGSLLRRAENALRALDGLIDGADALAERLAATGAEVADVAETALGFAGEESGDPTVRIDKIEGRLDAIAKLKRKYGGSISAVLDFRERAAAELDALDCSDEAREKLARTCAELRVDVDRHAAVLRGIRERAAETVVTQVTEALRFLDMPKVRMEIRVAPAPPTVTGEDDVEFLIATNPGEPVQPLAKIASGGELSRMMLALRSVLDDKNGAATVIFDEIDTGVSGKTSRKIGLKLRETAAGSQVLCVTHSAQIASLADRHYLITKTEKDGRAETAVQLLSGEERVEEIARILGGIAVTDTQRVAAREMIDAKDAENLGGRR